MAKRLILMCRFRSFSISNLSPQSEYLAFVSVQTRAEDEMRRSNTLQSAWTKLASESHLCSFRSLFFVSFKFLLSLFASVQSRAEDEMRRETAGINMLGVHTGTHPSPNPSPCPSPSPSPSPGWRGALLPNHSFPEMGMPGSS